MKPAAVRPRAAFVALFLVITGFLAATYSYRRITDTELNSFQTRALVLHGDVDLSRYQRVNRPGYFTIERDGKLFSIYGTGVSVVAAPIHAVLSRTGATQSVLEGAASIPFVAASILLMYLAIARVVDRRMAIAGAVVFGFGTTMWPLASMAMFQHGPVAMFQALALMALFSDHPRAPALAGLGFGFATFIRPTTAIAFGLVGLFYLTRGKRPLLLFLIGSLVPIAGILAQNRWIWGTWLTGGYSLSGVAFDADVPSALWGLTFGWWRGIFVYSPVLIIGVASAVMVLRDLRDQVAQRLAVIGLACLATVLFYARWSTWHNGFAQFGYRYLLDIVPFLVILGAYGVAKSRRLRVAALPLAVVSILTMTAGAGPNNFGFDGVRFATRVEDTSLGQAWIAFLDEPLTGGLRLAGLAAVVAAMALLAPPRPPARWTTGDGQR